MPSETSPSLVIVALDSDPRTHGKKQRRIDRDGGTGHVSIFANDRTICMPRCRGL